jgi:threonine/homoserine/homoserine lactone efflux protein
MPSQNCFGSGEVILDLFLSFIITCFLIEITPGPNMAYLAILSISEGRRAGLYVVAGVALGLLTVGIGASLGLAALIASSKLIYQALRWGGVFYLLWLAWDTWNTSKAISPERTDQILWKRRRLFERGFITNLLNPKAAIFYIAILPSFISASSSLIIQNITLTTTYVCIATIIHSSIVLLAGTAQPFFNNPKKILYLRRFLAVMLIGVALWFAVSTGRSSI